MSDLPAWAMEKAIKVAQVVLRNLPDDYGDMSLEIGTIARALVAEYERGVTDGRDDVAVERRERDAYARGVKEERELDAKIAETFLIAQHIAHSMKTGVFPDVSRVEDAIAAAIRNQKEEV